MWPLRPRACNRDRHEAEGACAPLPVQGERDRLSLGEHFGDQVGRNGDRLLLAIEREDQSRGLPV